MQYIMTTDKFDIDIIEQTLEKYYNGTSTLAEEQMLLEYFTSTSEIPNKFHNDRDIFISEEVQHRVRFAAEISSERAVDAVRVHFYVVPRESFCRCVYSVICLFSAYAS